MNRVLTGATASVAAAVPMMAYWEYMHRSLEGEPPRPLPPREIVEAALVKAGLSRQASEIDVQRLTLAAHFGYAASTGALFGVFAPRTPFAGIGAGIAFGLAVWSGSYLGWLPATGMRQPVRYDMPSRTRLMITSHILWGATLGLFTALGRGRRGRASRLGRARA
jgi:hypothetical protein